MAFLSKEFFSADGVGDTFAVNFSYIAEAHIKAFVDGVEDTTFTFNSPTQIKLSSVPASGTLNVLVKRVTPTAPLTDFVDGSVLPEADLDRALEQSLFIAEETKDESDSALSEDTTGQFDAENKRIINLANPVNDQDAASKVYADALVITPFASPLGIGNGGTGSTTAPAARTALGPFSDVLATPAGGTEARTLANRFGDILNVKDFGAKGDGIFGVDGAITTGTPDFTSALASFTAADVGKEFSCIGAGASGAVLQTTILALVSETAVTLAANAGTTVSSARYSYATNDTTAIQAAADAQKPILFPVGMYGITTEIVFDDGTKFFGSGYWGGFEGEPDEVWDTIIMYFGSGGADSAMFRVSTAAVGVDPTDEPAGFRNLKGVGVQHMSLDGNGTAEYGIYMARAGMATIWDKITVQHTKEHGIWGGLIFNATFLDVVCSDNEKNGFTFGRNDFTWAKNTLNASIFINCRAVDNGTAKTFDEATNLREGIGWDVVPHRGNVFLNCHADENDGPGWLISPLEGPNVWVGGHCELNCQLTVGEARSTRVWGIWFEGQAAGVSLNTEIGSMFLNSDQFIKLAGTEPSSTRFEGGVHLKNLRIGAGVDADWDNYDLENCSSDIFTNLVGTAPQKAVKRLNTAVIVAAFVETATLDFADTSAQTHTDLTITVTGAVTTDAVTVRAPPAAILAGTSYSAWVSAADTVTVRFNNYSTTSKNPGSNPFKVIVWRTPTQDVTE